MQAAQETSGAGDINVKPELQSKKHRRRVQLVLYSSVCFKGKHSLCTMQKYYSMYLFVPRNIYMKLLGRVVTPE
jgi:hypothetical protein